MGLEVDQSSPSSAKVKSAELCPHSPSMLSWFMLKYRDICTYVLN